MSVSRACLSPDVLGARFLRSTLLALADSRYALFEPLWSDETLRYLASCVSEDDATTEEVVWLLRAAWPGCELDPSTILEELGDLQLAEAPKLLLATAISGQADTIVTVSPGDYPRTLCERFHLVPLSPDGFLRRLFFPERTHVVNILTRMVAAELRVISFREFLGGLLAAGVEQFPYDLTNFRSVMELEALTDQWRDEFRRD